MSRRSHRLAPGVRYADRKPRLSREARHRQARSRPGRWWVAAAVTVVVVLAVLVAIRVWVQAQPARPDVNALHADIAGGRTGAEVTFDATVVAPPASVGDHEQIDVRDSLGDALELDYNTQLGRWIPLHVGDRLLVHGQLYIDPGRVGVHCLHAQTSQGCPESGWVQFAGATYS